MIWVLGKIITAMVQVLAVVLVLAWICDSAANGLWGRIVAFAAAMALAAYLRGFLAAWRRDLDR